MRRALRCFVAMAIREGEDTDTLHFKVLKPTLKAKGINAVRIDEIHHNKNIDERILREIDSADLVIADLTYERPSVYFEAGYAEAERIPVIYTCRSDHFGRHGKYQIHFDLRQRNIVGWKTPHERRFRSKLLARVRHTVAPLLQRLQRDDATRKEESAFAGMSAARRVAALRATIDETLRRAGFRTDDEDPAGYPSGHRGRRITRGKATGVQVFVFESLPKSELVRLAWAFAHPIRVTVDQSKSRTVSHHVIGVTESTVTKARVGAVFVDFEPVTNGTWMTKKYPRLPDGRPAEHWLHVMDKVRSVSQLRARLTAILDRALSTDPRPLVKE